MWGRDSVLERGIGMKRCKICGSTYQLERHHLLGGMNRKKSEQYGLVMMVCHDCHTAGERAIHRNPEMMLKYKKVGQRMFERDHTREEFIQEFGQDYLWRDEE